MALEKVVDLDPVETAEQRALSLTKQIAKQVAQTNIRFIEMLSRIIFNNPQGLTPEQVCAAFGTKGVALYDLAVNVKQLTDIITGTSIQFKIGAGYSGIKKNVDGTIQPIRV